MPKRLDPKEDALDDLYKGWLRLHALNKTLETRHGISFSQLYMLRWIFHYPGITPGILSKKMGLHPSSLSPLMRRLIRKTYIALELDPWDKRRKFLTITRLGKSILDKTEPELRRI